MALCWSCVLSRCSSVLSKLVGEVVLGILDDVDVEGVVDVI